MRWGGRAALTGAIIVAVLGVASCSLLTDFNGLAETVVEAGPGSLASDRDAPPAETSTTNVDASADAETGADAAVPCLLCDDFERVSVKGNWDGVDDAPSTLTLDSTTSKSPTRSLRISLPAAADSSQYAYLHVAFPGDATTKTKIFLSLYVRVDAFPIREVHGPAVFFTGPPRAFVFFQMRDLEIQMVEQTGTDVAIPYSLGSGGSQTGWQKWTLTVDATVSPPIATATVGTLSVTHALVGTFVGSATEMYGGSAYALDGDAFTYWIDDVQFFVSH